MPARRAARWRALAVALVACRPCCRASAELECDLSPWVANEGAPGEEGYHVLCFTAPRSAQIYRSGVATDRPLALTFDTAASLRPRLTQLLKIRDKLVYNAQDPEKRGPPLRWAKQPWTLFSEGGEELRVGTEAEYVADALRDGRQGLLLLLFEGGAWRWPTIRVGFDREALPGVHLRTVSRQPALFEVTLRAGSDAELGLDLLSNVVTLAEGRLEPSRVETHVDKAQRSSEQTFLAYHEDPKLLRLQAATARLLRGHNDTLEDLQVLRYSVHQHYDAHRDYWDPREFPDVPRFTNAEGYWHQRHATLLWYLAAPALGGETWFPRAHGGPIPYGEWMACDDRGAKVSPANATAVLFYSLQADGDIDEFSWHSGCPVKAGTKWAANSWMYNNPGNLRPPERRPLTTVRQDL